MVLSALTSAAMFGFKISTLEMIKYSMEMQSKLDEERSALVAELDTAILSPSIRKKVSEILQHHPNPDVSMFSHHDPQRPHYMEESPPRQVRSTPAPPHVSSLPVVATLDVHDALMRSLRFV
jgi:hypothetical protein